MCRLQESRFWIHPSRRRPHPPQPPLGRLTLHYEHRLPILLLRPTSLMVVHDNLRSHASWPSIQRPPFIPLAENHNRSNLHGPLPPLLLDHGRYFQLA